MAVSEHGARRDKGALGRVGKFHAGKSSGAKRRGNESAREQASWEGEALERRICRASVVVIHGFKEYCALLFFKGALLKDPNDILVRQTKNVQAARQIRFTSLAEIEKQRAAVVRYLKEAIAVEKSGAKVKMKTVAQFTVPAEFQTRLDTDPVLAKAFHALSPGRQKGYLLYFAGAKQSATRAARVEKHVPRILKGLGLND
jgi:uncharacterized protein YdeI (YjbR/CyaY-like superfamily)